VTGNAAAGGYQGVVPRGHAATAATVVRCDNVVHVYGTPGQAGAPGQEVTALRGVDLTVAEADTVALLGPSGAGKSTLLWLLAGLLRPTAGIVEVCGRRLSELSPRLATRLRRHDVGVVLQTPARNLLSYETALGNLLFAQRPVSQRRSARHRRAGLLLDTVGLAGVAHQPAGRLSGGEQQRLAVAVALANEPRLLLADEPTSQLDHASAAAVIDLIKSASQDLGTTVVVVTHDPAVGSALGRTITIRDGRVGAEGRAGKDYVVVGRDGTLQLPTDMLEILPPGSLARAVRTRAGVELRPVERERG